MRECENAKTENAIMKEYENAKMPNGDNMKVGQYQNAKTPNDDNTEM